MRMFLILSALLIPTAVQAQAPPACGPRDKVIAVIAGPKYSEQPMLELGNVDGTSVMHLYGNTATGTWTLVVYPQPGLACLIATGKSIEPMGGKPLEPPVDPT